MNYEQIIHILNGYASNFLAGNVAEKFEAIDFGTPFNVQLINQKDDIVTLEKAQSGGVKYQTDSLCNSDLGAIIRVGIGFRTCLKMSQDKDYFYYHMSLLMNKALLSLSKVIGNLDKREVRVESPGHPGVYFRMLDNSFVELRFYTLP